jgi:hypothetical protein
MQTPKVYGKYVLDIDFEKLNEQRDLLKRLAGLLNYRDRALLNGLSDLLQHIEIQELRTDTAVPNEHVEKLVLEGILSSKTLLSRKA